MEAKSKQLSPDLAAVDGLDILFTDDATNVTTDTGDTIDTQEITVNATDWWSLQDAADNLNLSTRSVLRWLKSGKLSGTKIHGSNGPEWRITPIDNPPSTVKTTASNVTPDTGQLSNTPDITLVKELLEKLEVLTYRNGYLEAQLAAKDEHIKLLTDSTQQLGWWNRTCNWLLGR